MNSAWVAQSNCETYDTNMKRRRGVICEMTWKSFLSILKRKTDELEFLDNTNRFRIEIYTKMIFSIFLWENSFFAICHDLSGIVANCMNTNGFFRKFPIWKYFPRIDWTCFTCPMNRLKSWFFFSKKKTKEWMNVSLGFNCAKTI